MEFFTKAKIDSSEALCFILKACKFEIGEIADQIELHEDEVKNHLSNASDKLSQTISTLNNEEKNLIISLISPNKPLKKAEVPSSEIIFKKLKSMNIKNNPFVDL